MEAVFGLIGIKNQMRSVVVQPTLLKGPEAAEEALEDACKMAWEIVVEF